MSQILSISAGDLASLSNPGKPSLREDFARPALLLGATDGEDLFTPDER